MDIQESAKALLACRKSGKAMSASDWLASGLAPTTEAEAYAVQAALVELMEADGGKRIGYKIGATNQAARDMLGVSGPLYGVLWEGQTVEAPAAISFMPSLHKVAEAEIALRMGQDVDASAFVVDADTIRSAVAEVIPVVEIAGTSIDPWLDAGGETLIADNGLQALWVRGEPVPDWSGFDPIELTVEVYRTLGDAQSGKGGAVDGGAFGAAAWLANKLAEHGQILRAGDYISTGSTTVPVPVVAGDQLSCNFGPLGTVEVAIQG